MAVKKCDDIVEETTTTEEGGSGRKRKRRPKRARQVQAQISLGKTIEIVEKMSMTTWLPRVTCHSWKQAFLMF